MPEWLAYQVLVATDHRRDNHTKDEGKSQECNGGPEEINVAADFSAGFHSREVGWNLWKTAHKKGICVDEVDI